jgi:negative regulator of sigma E activity
MNELDDELRNALRREPAPAGFAERVLRRVGEQAAVAEPGQAPRRAAWTRGPARLAAAAAIVAAVAGGIQYRSFERARVEREAGEAAKEQVIKALRITASKLQLVQAKVREVGS